MRVELLYFDGCPSWRAAYDHLKMALVELGFSDDVRLVHVKTNDQALGLRFAGSPTIRLDGQDLFPTDQTDYGLGCRLYMTPEGMRGYPTVGMLREAIHQHFPKSEQERSE
jgi:hypothetical protein